MASFKHKVRGGEPFSKEREQNLKGHVGFMLSDPKEILEIELVFSKLYTFAKPELDNQDEDPALKILRVAMASIRLANIAFTMMGFTADGAAATVKETIRHQMQSINNGLQKKHH